MLYLKKISPLVMLLACICCESEDPEISCTESDLSIALEITHAGCEASDGIITISASGGRGTYTYGLAGSSESSEAAVHSQFTGLSTGEYTVSVTDENGCSISASAEVISGISLSKQVMPIIDQNCTISSCHQLLGPSLETAEDVISIATEIKTVVESGSMPPPTEPGLTEDEVSLIVCWVNDVVLNK